MVTGKPILALPDSLRKRARVNEIFFFFDTRVNEIWQSTCRVRVGEQTKSFLKRSLVRTGKQGRSPNGTKPLPTNARTWSKTARPPYLCSRSRPARRLTCKSIPRHMLVLCYRISSSLPGRTARINPAEAAVVVHSILHSAPALLSCCAGYLAPVHTDRSPFKVEEESSPQ